MNNKGVHNIYRYWGKVNSSEEGTTDYHLLAYHCLDVAAVGEVLLENQPALLQQFRDLSGVDDVRQLLSWGTFLFAIHDVGKFAEGFQNCQPNLFKLLQKRNTTVPYSEHHTTLGYRFCREYLTPFLMKIDMHKNNIPEKEKCLWDLLELWVCAVTGHHGRPPTLNAYPLPIDTQFPEQVRDDVLAFIQDIVTILLPDGLPFQLNADNLNADSRYYQIFPRVSWLMAGLTVASDWIGSNSRWFRYFKKPMALADYWHDAALPQARTAVTESGLTNVGVSPFLGMRMLFPGIAMATPLQHLVEEIDIPNGPHLFIVEEVTAGGKTEVALTLAHRLMAKGESDGLFIALPTMATANAMHRRVEVMYRKLFTEEGKPSLILAHSSSRMVLEMEEKNRANNGHSQGDSSTSQDCTAWLADSRKKALLAHVGVGTIDQALLAVLAVNFQSIRLLGLARKVLIVDEVHACDAYVHRLLCTLLQFHAAHGGSAILLSATLPQAMRAELLNSFAKGAGTKDVATKSIAYPLLTHFSAVGVTELPVSARALVSRHVQVQPIHSVNRVKEMLKDALNAGYCACWVCNTVYDALLAYRELVGQFRKEQVMLFHARFTLGDRLKIEQEVLERFGPYSTDEIRQSKLVIATQVIEQSLDLDFDFMVSDLAPIDSLIQRAGRLHRRMRSQRRPPIFGVFMPQPVKEAGKDWFEGMFPKASKVYRHHGQLWLTARWMYERRGFSMPEDAREMIEWVYGEQSQTAIPENLLSVEQEAMGEDTADGCLGRLNGLKLDDGYQPTMTNWPDDVLVPTRLGEPTVTVRLARFNGRELLPWNADNTGHDWELSQLSIRKRQIASEDPNYLTKLVASAKESMTDEGRYCVVIPMQESGGKWTGRAINGHDERVDVTYDARVGFEVTEDKIYESC